MPCAIIDLRQTVDHVTWLLSERKREKDLDTCRISAISNLTASTAPQHINNIDAAMISFPHWWYEP